MSFTLPDVGQRLSISGFLGTVRFVGSVDGTPGIWLGVEWDDQNRGKHSGMKDGKQYFSCRVPGSGSFIRPSASISYGVSFLEALQSRYIEALHGDAPETLILGSSHGVEVEAVRLDKIRNKFADLTKLRYVQHVQVLSYMIFIESWSPQRCTDIRGLDLSYNLIPSWDVLCLITVELGHLETLSLNHNRLEVPASWDDSFDPFPCLHELQLNGTLTTWDEALRIIPRMPNLRLLEMGYNSLSKLSKPSILPGTNCTLTTLNLEGNHCDDWNNLVDSLCDFQVLERLILASNGIVSIPDPPHRNHPQLKYLQHLSLAFNGLTSLGSADALYRWCPSLRTLALNNNPFMYDPKHGKHLRAFFIAKIPTLTGLDSTTITAKERTDSELFYLSWVAQQIDDENTRLQKHPQWEPLCHKHGRPDVSTSNERTGDRMKKHVFGLRLYRCETTPDHLGPTEVTALMQNVEPLHISTIPTMTIGTLRMKIHKLIKCRSKSSFVHLGLVMRDGSLAMLHPDRDRDDLSWLGVDGDSKLLFWVGDS